MVRIPYLNGGMFDEHQLEKQYQEIDIPDEHLKNYLLFSTSGVGILIHELQLQVRDINPTYWDIFSNNISMTVPRWGHIIPKKILPNI